jgi:uncharacterized protein
MTAKTLKNLISGYMKTKQPSYIFSWQGGEPTLMGRDFFQEVVKLQRAYWRPGTSIANSIQTNGVLIDDTFAGFLSKYDFLVGISLDGPGYIHDFYRTCRQGGGSFNGVMKGIDCLKRNGVEFNILVLVTRVNVKKAKEIYRFLCENGFFYHQYIECVEFDKNGSPLPYSITGEEWGNFLCELFDQWIESGINGVSIRLFDAVLARLVENRCHICRMGCRCDQYFVVEHNGDVYPCDFFVEKDLKLGNIARDSWHHVLASPIYAGFATQKSKWNRQCEHCEFQFICRGDCLKNRFYMKRDPAQLSWLCSGWKIFYTHALPGFRGIADTRQGRLSENSG